MLVKLDFNSAADYRLFLQIKALPRFKFTGRVAEIPDEYVHLLGLAPSLPPATDYVPEPWLFDYQRDISRLAIAKRKFAVFLACGWGKTGIMLEFVRHVAANILAGRCVLIVSPLMVVKQTLAEASRFYGDRLPIEQVRAKDLQAWLRSGSPIGITNYESLTKELKPGRLTGLVCDEASLLKSAYGRWGKRIIDLGKGLEWKLCLTGTPAPNDRIEYANHAVFLDQFPTANAFLSKYFINRGQTDNRWELKPHALRPFWTSLSHWAVFVENPATYGWKDNVASIPPIETFIHDVPLTEEQRELVSQAGGDMFGTPGGITSRAKLSQLAKGRYKGRDVASNKPAFIRDLIASWPEESTIIWCLYDKEQESLEKAIPGAASIKGSTPVAERERVIADFQGGRVKTLLSKPRVMGFGINMQIATRQVFSGLQDSWESFHQAVKRSNRVGSSRPLRVHIPITCVERAMVETVLAKAHRIQQDTEAQERIFKESWVGMRFCAMENE